MRRFLFSHSDSFYLIAFVLVLLFAALRIELSARAAPDNRILLPAVFQPPPASVCDGSPLLDTDVGAISAMRDADGNYDVALQVRSDGSRAHVMRHVGGHLEELALQVSLAISPAFSPPGPKQGALALVPNEPGGKSRLYYTERDQDDDPNEGPYKPRCLEF